jgi:hypothetical protein
VGVAHEVSIQLDRAHRDVADQSRRDHIGGNVLFRTTDGGST